MEPKFISGFEVSIGTIDYSFPLIIIHDQNVFWILFSFKFYCVLLGNLSWIPNLNFVIYIYKHIQTHTYTYIYVHTWVDYFVFWWLTNFTWIMNTTSVWWFNTFLAALLIFCLSVTVFNLFAVLCVVHVVHARQVVYHWVTLLTYG